MNILHADEMNKLDEYAIGHIGIMQCVLMERAALGVSDCILKQFEKPSVLVLSGPGNCGGDGLALARILLDRGLNVRVYLPVALEKCKESVQNEAKLFESFGGKMLSVLPDEGAEVIVDAVFGVGLNRPVTGAFLDAIKWMNNQKEKSQAYIFSVDIPSGIHTDTGAVMGDAVKADYTVTFSCLKPGLLLYPGREYAGEISVSSIGIDSLTDTIIEPTCYTFRREEARLSKRSPYGNKGSFHRILIIAGSKDMCGAAVLASTAAFRSGAGLVEVYTHENNRDVLLSALPEAIVHTYPDFVETEELKSALAR
ncbi:MAG: NAD(P)H-hydrate epimerase, partial [Lachnospiraceae bacterium]|nr:NAD(P)H-hydrate epimerase [Lachnospiraceae bacterium]